MDKRVYGGKIDANSLDQDWSDPENRWWENDQSGDPPKKKKIKKFQPDGEDIDGKTIYLYGPGDLAESIERTERHLVDENVQFYARGGTLVRPIIDDVQAIEGRVLKSARLAPVVVAYMRKQMSISIRWMVYKKVKDDFIKIKCDPPVDVAIGMIANDGDWTFPTISGVITAPTLRRDGSILWREGYDPATNLLLLAPPKMPPFPENPTHADAMVSIARLDALLDGFPFVDPASRAVALSGLLTPVARAAMTVSPLHVISAPTPGSGKSFLVDLCAAIISGNAAPVMTAGKTEEETEKRLGAEMLAGSPIIAIDNVNGELYGDALCQCVERPVVKFRILGASKTVEVENKTTMFATGNNISLVSDMARRSVLCVLDPNTERPELRQFDSDPLSTILNNRGQYIADALTVVRAYKIAGSPGQLPRLASFGEWSDLIRSALVWLGYADPLSSMEKIRNADARLANLKSFVAQWWVQTMGEKKSAAELIHISTGSGAEDFQVAMKTFCNPRGNMDGTLLGTKLRAVDGRVIDGLKIQYERDNHSKSNMWWLEKFADSAGSTKF